MPYQVALAAFHGPLDLLLYLVKKDEVDILDIRIAELTAQFLDHLRVVQELDVEAAGDFLVMAATLMVIKSRTLVPKSDTAE
jgi:segregation and condensation protein A